LSPTVATAVRRVAPLLGLFLAAQTSGAQPFDHSLFDGLLRRHTSRGLVDYDAFASAPEFAQYLALLGRSSPDKLSHSEQLAYWINVYNAWTIDLINRHHERSSIQNIRSVLGHSPWQDPFVKAGGHSYTLDQVEHEILRKRFQEPRIHFAVVCAAVSCAPLRAEAYTGTRLELQLEDQARNYLLGRTKGSRVDVANGVVYVSKIFVWYRDDFGGTDASIGQFIARYYPDGPEKHILQGGRFRLTEFEYDWSLNRQPGG
jgi:uncharacterized protein DUF547